jgi:hypothetical protein
MLAELAAHPLELYTQAIPQDPSRTDQMRQSLTHSIHFHFPPTLAQAEAQPDSAIQLNSFDLCPQGLSTAVA